MTGKMLGTSVACVEQARLFEKFPRRVALMRLLYANWFNNLVPFPTSLPGAENVSRGEYGNQLLNRQAKIYKSGAMAYGEAGDMRCP